MISYLCHISYVTFERHLSHYSALWYIPNFDVYLVLKWILYSLVKWFVGLYESAFYLSSIWFRTVSVFLSLSQTSLLQPFIKYNRIYMKRTIISFKSLCSQGVSKQQLFEYIKRLQNVESSLILWETRIKNNHTKNLWSITQVMASYVWREFYQRISTPS